MNKFKENSLNFKVFFVLFSLSLALFSCQKNNFPQPEQKLIVASFYPVYIMTKNIATNVPGVKVVNLTRPSTGCLHDYQLAPRDLTTLDKAWVFVVNGMDMENFLFKVISRKPGLNIISAADGITPLRGRAGDINPHVWVSISLAIREVRNIAEGLAVFDPPHAGLYRQNASIYIYKLESLRVSMHSALDMAKNRNIITFHEAFPYFAQEFGLNVVAVIEREPGSQPSAGEMAKTIETIKKTGIKALFAEPQYSPKAARTLAKETGAKVFALDPAVVGPNDADAYLTIMRQNLEVLKNALR